MPANRKYNVLVCPLDWGMGHATRSVAIINELIAQGYHVIIGADNRPLEFLKIEFQNLKFVPFPGTKITYPSNNWMALKMFLSIPKFIYGVIQEHSYLKKIVKRHHIDIVISDNRYGLWHKKVPSIFITHQIGIKTPSHLSFLKPILLGVNKFFIHKYHELWIPDFEKEPNLSGNLSHGYKLKLPVYFIGPISRFKKTTDPRKKDGPEILGIVSGPEPQRTIFEDIMIREFQKYLGETAILRGMPEAREIKKINNITLYPHLSTPQFTQLLKNTNLVICRSGYCTLMDLAIMNLHAVVIPTPGQTEQEYLARRLQENQVYFSQEQSSFSLDEALNKYQSYSGILINNDHKILRKRIQLLTPI